jgi:hypothetical protein
MTLTSYARMFDLARWATPSDTPHSSSPTTAAPGGESAEWQNAEAICTGVRRVGNGDHAPAGGDRAVRPVRPGAGGGSAGQRDPLRPGQPLHDRYKVDFGFVDDDELSLLDDMAMTINTFFGWDFNSCEALRRDGVFHPIDFANANPDSQVTSLHYHIPWLVKAKIRWSLYCAATRRRMRHHPDWTPFFLVADTDMPYREKLRSYAAIAQERYETERFHGLLLTPPGRSRRGDLGVLRHRPGQGGRAAEGGRAVPLTRSSASPSTSGVSSSSGGRPNPTDWRTREPGGAVAFAPSRT